MTLLKKTICFVLFLICVFLTLPFVSYACDLDAKTLHLKLIKRQQEQFQKYDTNQNKTITIGEFILGESKAKKGGDVNVHPFLAQDKDKSGDLSFEEWQVFRKPNYYMIKNGC